MAADIQVVSVGTVGPAGPGSVSPGAVITGRGGLIVGDATATPDELPVGASGTYLRSDGDDPAYSVILAADLPTAIDAAKLADGTVSNAELQYLNGVTSAIQTQIDGKAATAHTHLDASRGIQVYRESTSVATPSDNTASTTTWADAMDDTITLPAGTWTLSGVGGVALKHSADGAADGRLTIDGQDSTERTADPLSSTLFTALIDDEGKSGCSGDIHIRVQFRSVDAGTTYARNPWYLVIAERSS